MANVTLIDNYDSFTFNLVHYFGELGARVTVHRNDKIGVETDLAHCTAYDAAGKSLRSAKITQDGKMAIIEPVTDARRYVFTR